jgi:hypothetical protein
VILVVDTFKFPEIQPQARVHSSAVSSRQIGEITKLRYLVRKAVGFFTTRAVAQILNNTYQDVLFVWLAKV